MSETHTFTVNLQQEHQRLDRFLVEQLPKLSRSYIKQLIEDDHVTVNGKDCKPSYLVNEGDQIILVRPISTPTQLIAEDIPLEVVYEDADVVVINKPAGMVVHPAPGHASGTLVNALLYHYPNLSTSGDLRPGIVHRIDKDTSGLIVVARNDSARHSLIQQQQARLMTKRYQVLVYGHWRDPLGVIDAPIGRHPVDRLRMTVLATGRHAITYYRVLEELGPYSLIEATLGTGRTHQIRVHCAFKHRPVVGDPLYGPRRHQHNLGLARQFLQACQLGFRLPSTNAWCGCQIPLAAELETVLATLRRRYESVVINAPLAPNPPDTDHAYFDDAEAHDE